MLGVREPAIYGDATLADAEALCRKTASGLDLEVDCRQTNHIGKMIDWIQESRTSHKGIIINAGGYSHTSVALLDALLASDLPIIEVHVTNIYAREAFRQHSLLSKAAKGVICGLGIDGYGYALQAIKKLIK